MSKSAELKSRKAAAVPAGVGSRGVYVAKTENSELWDVDGRRFIDFAAGIAVLNTGHRHPRVMEAGRNKRWHSLTPASMWRRTSPMCASRSG